MFVLITVTDDGWGENARASTLVGGELRSVVGTWEQVRQIVDLLQAVQSAGPPGVHGALGVEDCERWVEACRKADRSPH